MIKLKFCGFWREFYDEDNFLINIIKRNFGECCISEEPDFVFFSNNGIEHYKYKNCVKIFYTGEPIAPDFNVCDYAIAFDPISFGERYMRNPIWLNVQQPNTLEITDEELLNRKFCNFVYSNDSRGDAVQFRIKFAKRLMEYKSIDCPGKVLNNMTDAIEPRRGNWEQGKLEFIKKYKFTIAFENSSYQGYTTEKMLDPFAAHSLPIYWGNPNVDEFFNEDAFINCNGFEEKIDDIINKIIQIDSNNDEYLSMLHQKPMNTNYNSNEIRDFENFIVNIVKRGNHPFTKDPLHFTKDMMFYDVSFKKKIKNLLMKV